MRKLLKGIFIVAVLALFGQNQIQAQDNRALSPFDELSVIGNIEVILEEGAEEKAVIYTKNIDLDDVSVSVKGNVLKLRLLKSVFHKDDEVKIEITYKTLRIIKGSAGAKITSNSTLEGDKILTRAHSGATIDLSVNVNVVDGAAYEGSVLKLRGKTDSQEAVAATGGRYEAINLDSNRTTVKANTGGEAKVVANQSLDAAANTGGEVKYKGEPEERNTRKIISGKITKI